MLNDFARLAPRRSPKGKKSVQGILRKNMSLHSAAAQDRFLKFGRTEVTEFFQNGKIDNVLTDRDSNTRCALFRFEDSKWKILDGKMRFGRDFDKRFKRHFRNCMAFDSLAPARSPLRAARLRRSAARLHSV